MDPVGLEDEGDLEDFFGQLWFFPTNSSPSRGRVRVRHRDVPEKGILVWIRRDLWESKKFEPIDCHQVGESDSWDLPPKFFSFAEDFWGKGIRETFVSKLKSDMAGRGRGGRGPRPRNPEEEWGWGEGGWYQPPPFYPPPMGPMGPYPPPQPGPFGYFPNQAPANQFFNQGPSQGQNQFNQQSQRGQGVRPGGRGGNQNVKSRTQMVQGQQSRNQQQYQPARVPAQQQNTQALQKQAPNVNSVELSGEQTHAVVIEEGKLVDSKAAQVVCYNCGEVGHYVSVCSKPKVCFVCFKEDHIAEKCPRWLEPEQVVQYMGSANKGSGFLHIDVAPLEERFKLWTGFDNCGVLTIEEGAMDQDTLLKHLRGLFDANWNWQLRSMDEYSYLVRFPPDL